MPRQPAKSKKKRTQRAVRGRRTLDEREQAANLKLDEWITKMRFAMNKVDHYQAELKSVRQARASATADEVFGKDSK